MQSITCSAVLLRLFSAAEEARPAEHDDTKTPAITRHLLLHFVFTAN